MTKQKENGITWTEETWNPIRGCSRISKGCMNCYAEGVANRFKGEGQPYEGLIASTGQWNGKVKMIDHMLNQPLRWQRPRLIFVNSMSDLFHESLTDQQIDRIFVVMAIAAQHTFQVLTKRAERMAKYFMEVTVERLVESCQDERGVSDIPYYSISQIRQRFGLPDVARYKEPVKWPLKNVWLGVSVEDQASADERIPHLLKTPAAVRWISAEPLIGAIDLGQSFAFAISDIRAGARIGWCVVGGESGTGARPMHPEWARSLRDQCVAAGVAYHFKQWGEWAPRAGLLTGGGTDFSKLDPSCKTWPNVIRLGEHGKSTNICENCGPDAGQDVFVQRVGKRLSGRLLDGRTWDEYPVGYEKAGSS